MLEAVQSMQELRSVCERYTMAVPHVEDTYIQCLSQ